MNHPAGWHRMVKSTHLDMSDLALWQQGGPLKSLWLLSVKSIVDRSWPRVWDGVSYGEKRRWNINKGPDHGSRHPFLQSINGSIGPDVTRGSDLYRKLGPLGYWQIDVLNSPCTKSSDGAGNLWQWEPKKSILEKVWECTCNRSTKIRQFTPFHLSNMNLYNFSVLLLQ